MRKLKHKPMGITIKKLPKYFDGIGEVKGFKFRQLHSTDLGYIYEVTDGSIKRYETIKKTVVQICLDFKKRKYSETEFKEVYPKAKSFGIDGWTFDTYEKAKEKLLTLETQ